MKRKIQTLVYWRDWRVIRYLGGFLLICLIGSAGCEAVTDSIWQWGERSRFQRQEKIREIDIKKWQKMLRLSREKSIQLHRYVQDIVQESRLQGRLSRKIGNAFLQEGRYDLAAAYYNGALQKKLPQANSERKINPELRSAPEKSKSYSAFEESLRFFDFSLLHSSSDRELFYEAGLSYANASRAQGWEPKRFRIAEMLFRRMEKMSPPNSPNSPNDVRPLYQLALLYGKTTLENYKDSALAVKLLRRLLQREKKHIQARFALAHFLVERNENAKAVQEYEHILEILRDMHRKKLISGPLDSYRNYRKAKENKEKLQDCLNVKQGCIF